MGDQATFNDPANAPDAAFAKGKGKAEEPTHEMSMDEEESESESEPEPVCLPLSCHHQIPPANHRVFSFLGEWYVPRPLPRARGTGRVVLTYTIPMR